MNNINELFFDLIRVAIGTQETLSRQPSAQEWKQLYKMARKQSLVGICFAGVQKIVSRSPLKDEEEVETKTIKTPSSTAGSANPTLDESSVPSENKLSSATANSSNGTSSDAAIANGDKQEINNFEKEVSCPLKDEIRNTKDEEEVETSNNVFCGAATGLLPDAVVNPSMGYDVDGGLTMGACSQSQTDIHSTQSDSENNSRRGFSEGAVFVNSTDQDFSGFCQNINEEAPIPEMLYLRWMGMAAKIQQRNEMVNRKCVELQRMLDEKGFDSLILKGQGVATLYKVSEVSKVPESSINHKPSTINLSALRQSGDIDVWAMPKVAIADGWMVMTADERRKRISECCAHLDRHYDRKKEGYLHTELKIFADTNVEWHFTPSFLSNPFANRRLQKWFEEQWVASFMLDVNPNAEPYAINLQTPSVEFNLVFLLLHIYRHMLFEGIGMRQVLDYYMALRAVQDGQCSKAAVQEVKRTIKELGMQKFASSVMYVMREVFGMEEKYMICPMDEQRGRRLLEVIMEGGNFGHSTEKYKITGWDKPWSRLSRYVRRNWFLLWDYPDEILNNILGKIKQ